MRTRARDFKTAYYAQSGTEKTEPPYAPLFVSIQESSLPEHEKDVERLAQEGFIMIGAGGETTSRILSMAFFHIISEPRVLKRLQNEIMMVMPNATVIPSVKALDELVYLVIIL